MCSVPCAVGGSCVQESLPKVCGNVGAEKLWTTVGWKPSRTIGHPWLCMIIICFEFNKRVATHLDWNSCLSRVGFYHTKLCKNMLTCAGTCIVAMMYRQVLEQIEATSLPPQGKLEVTFGFISFLHPLMVLKNWNGNDWCSDNPNVPLKIAVISALIWSSDHSVENDIFPTRPAWANLVWVSLGITKTNASGEKGKHMTSFVYVFTFLRFNYPDRAPLRHRMDGRGAYWKQADWEVFVNGAERC